MFAGVFVYTQVQKLSGKLRGGDDGTLSNMRCRLICVINDAADNIFA